jgi:phosphoenolpyruvate-protein kinase (PTS system EI component)
VSWEPGSIIERILSDRPPPWIGLSGQRPSVEIVERSSGIGLVRAERILAPHKSYVTTAVGLETLRTELRCICSAALGHEVWYRTTDFEARLLNTLDGCDETRDEDNPLIGLRGIRRAMRHPNAFEAELRCIADLQRELVNLRVLFPFVRDAREVAYALDRARACGVTGMLGTMVEVPSAALDIENILSTGVEHVLVGVNDLTALAMGSGPSSVGFQTGHPAVVYLVQQVLTACQRQGISVRVAVGSDLGILPAFSDWPSTIWVVNYDSWLGLVRSAERVVEVGEGQEHEVSYSSDTALPPIDRA